MATIFVPISFPKESKAPDVSRMTAPITIISCNTMPSISALDLYFSFSWLLSELLAEILFFAFQAGCFRTEGMFKLFFRWYINWYIRFI